MVGGCQFVLCKCCHKFRIIHFRDDGEALTRSLEGDAVPDKACLRIEAGNMGKFAGSDCNEAYQAVCMCPPLLECKFFQQ